MTSEMKRWTDEENFFFWSENVWSQIWCYLKLVRWRERWRDEENFFGVRTCIKPNLVLSEISEMKSEMKRRKKNFLGPNMYQSKSGVKNFPFIGGGGGVPKSYIQAYIHTYRHHSDQISRSARETERLIKWCRSFLFLKSIHVQLIWMICKLVELEHVWGKINQPESYFLILSNSVHWLIFTYSVCPFKRFTSS